MRRYKEQYKMTRLQLEQENARLKYEIKMLSKDYYTDKIKDYLIHNGVSPELARVLATDIYKMAIGDL